MEGDGERSTEDILAAFRSRKAAASAGQPPEPAAAAAPDPPAPTAVPAEPPLPPQVPASPAASSSTALVADATPVPALRPAVQGASSLAAASPALRLTDRLLADRFVSGRGSLPGVLGGAAVAVLGALLALSSRVALVASRWPEAREGLEVAGLVLVGLGIAAAALFSAFPRSRRLRVQLAGTQREEWDRLQAEAASLRRLGSVGLILSLAGAFVVAVVLTVPLPTPFGLGWILGAVAGAAGLVLVAWTALRRSLVQRLYVQTLVLARLEKTGLSPSAEADPRVAPVLRSLDRLLGALPESAVRRFLASDEANSYLEMMDELEGRRGG